jgi:hypothetical protein
MPIKFHNSLNGLSFLLFESVIFVTALQSLQLPLHHKINPFFLPPYNWTFLAGLKDEVTPCHAPCVRQRFEQLTKETFVVMWVATECVKLTLGKLNTQWRTSFIDTACLFIVNLCSSAMFIAVLYVLQTAQNENTMARAYLKISFSYFITYLFTCGTEPFLRSCQLGSHSRTSQDFMEHVDLLPCSQEPSTGPYPEPDRSSPYHPIISL